jgi:hypothetical protein
MRCKLGIQLKAYAPLKFALNPTLHRHQARDEDHASLSLVQQRPDHQIGHACLILKRPLDDISLDLKRLKWDNEVLSSYLSKATLRQSSAAISTAN